MSEMQKLLEDYYRDMNTIAESMIAWCEPTQETVTKIKKLKKTAVRGLKALKGKK